MRRTLAGVLAAATLGVACGGGGEPEGEPLPPNAEAVLAAAAQSMGEVTSVRFELTRSGAPVYIDRVESLALDELVGRFVAPESADAVLKVTVNGSLTTQLGAVALDGEVWLSNPITGTFEPLNEGYDIDPARFFDPKGGWRPLLAELEDAVFVGEEDRGGTRYHVRGTAPAERMDAITAGLVDDDVLVDFWLRRDTGLVTAVEFDTTHDGGTSSWVLELRDYGDEFEIEPPENVRV